MNSVGACGGGAGAPHGSLGEPIAGTAEEESPPAAREPSTSPAPTGPRPPDFELETIDGGSVRLGDHLGRDVVLLDFWATYCDPCLAAMPHLDEVYRKHKAQGFLVLGISIDGPDSIAQVRAEVSKAGVSFPILLDEESRVVALYNPKSSAPFSVLIGRDGRIVRKQEGYTRSGAERLEAEIEGAVNVK